MEAYEENDSIIIHRSRDDKIVMITYKPTKNVVMESNIEGQYFSVTINETIRDELLTQNAFHR